MSSPAAEKLTQILSAVQAGETDTAEAMLPLLYEELRGLAHAKMAHEPAGHTLTATALVHEAYLRLVQDADVGWKSRAYFFAAAAEAMRRILVERARRVAGLKRGGDRQRVAFEAAELTLDIDPAEMLAIDDALAELEHLRPRTCQVTKLRYFAGLTAEETASALDISVRTVRNEWRFARAWLHQRLGAEMRPGELIGLMWSNVDLERGICRLQWTKANRDRLSYLDDHAVALLRTLREERRVVGPVDAPVFVRTDGAKEGAPWTAGHLVRTWHRLRGQAAVAYCTPRDLRKTCGTNLAEADVNQRIAREVTGHSTTPVLEQYYQLARIKVVRDAVTKAAAPLRRALGAG